MYNCFPYCYYYFSHNIYIYLYILPEYLFEDNLKALHLFDCYTSPRPPFRHAVRCYVGFEVSFLGEGLWTFRALEGFFASVGSRMCFQVRSLCKTFPASFFGTIKLPKIGVGEHVPPHIPKV